jgi:hypothetical protein
LDVSARTTAYQNNKWDGAGEGTESSGLDRAELEHRSARVHGGARLPQRVHTIVHQRRADEHAHGAGRALRGRAPVAAFRAARSARGFPSTREKTPPAYSVVGPAELVEFVAGRHLAVGFAAAQVDPHAAEDVVVGRHEEALPAALGLGVILFRSS